MLYRLKTVLMPQNTGRRRVGTRPSAADYARYERKGQFSARY